MACKEEGSVTVGGVASDSKGVASDSRGCGK